MIAVELGKLLEKRAFVRLLDMLFERQQALGLGELEHLIEQAQQLQIAFLVVARPLQHGAHAPCRCAQHGFRVGDDEGADRRADDDDGFEGLP